MSQAQPSQQNRNSRDGRHRKPRRRGHRGQSTHSTFRPFTDEQLAARRAALPRITYPPALPVSERVSDIAAAIEDNQVVIIAGATGSGKTTQIPKICLELGRGITGMIGHTQPRRIAARTVAERISEETGTELGQAIGYQVRFTDHVSATSLVKVMTDGILLAEIQRDPLLRRYDTIIVDEAHERSLNIDFLLGYLHRLLPKRKDLKVIVTSATIDSERFARYFSSPAGPAPVIEVSGRTYPVEIRYRPLIPDTDDAESAENPSGQGLGAGSGSGSGADSDSAASAREAASRSNSYAGEDGIDQPTGICLAADELMAEGGGDILVFCSGEREIRDATDALASHLGPRFITAGAARGTNHAPGAVEVIPLYARLSAAEQHRVFQPHSTRRIVIATNVAETSLTVPGIRYVIDTGTARISRYSARTKVQRLPIEPISQASANQRSGRCGRVAEGICIRLYSRRDFDSRPEYTEPEILRTSLASVILQMAAAGLGDIAKFDFLDSPDSRAIKAGTQLLAELGAVDDSAQLTKTGRALAKLPIDPRLGRMIIEAGRLGCLREVMIIVAALSVQDARERPSDHQQAADEKHRRFADANSDFIAILNLWNYIKDLQHELSSSAFRRRCKAEFLHFLRIREWQDVHTQLRHMVKQIGLEWSHQRAGDIDTERIHRALLSGLLSHLGYWDERKRDYTGARGTKFVIFPGSYLAKSTPAWVMASELVETSRLFARTVARIKPEWAESLAGHIAKHNYSEPYWSSKSGAAMVKEKVLLYGLPIVSDRRIPLGRVDGELAREMFITNALVEGDWRTHHKFYAHNQRVLAEAEEAQARERRHDLLIDEQGIFDFYDERIPAFVTSARHFDSWWKNERGSNPQLLSFTQELVLPRADELDEQAFPKTWTQGDITLPLTYEFSPGSEMDGVCVHIPIAILARVRESGFDWMVPGLLEELTVATIKALPKKLRVSLVPAPDTARQLLPLIERSSPFAPASNEPETLKVEVAGATGYLDAFAAAARELRGADIRPGDVDPTRIPTHLRMCFQVHDARGKVLGTSRELALLQRQLASQSAQAVRNAVRGALAAAADGDAHQGRSSSPGKGKSGAAKPGQAGVTGTNRASGSAAGKPGPAGADPSAGGAAAAGLAEIDGLTDWPAMAKIPRSVSSTGPGGLAVRGYPALVAEGATVGLRVLTSAEVQAIEHRRGVAKLLTCQLALGTKRVTSRWSGTQSLALAASPYSTTEALVADIQAAATMARVGEDDLANVITKERFAGLLESMRDGFEDEVARISDIAATIMTRSRELDGAIKDSTSMALLNVLTDLKDQRAGLVYPGFIGDIHPEDLAQIPRYLAGAIKRLAKAETNPHRDTELAWKVGQLTEEWQSALAASEHEPVRHQRLERVKWQLEELKISFFAQELGTAFSVSEKRVRKAIAAA